jgi:hypothetical protein
VGGLVPIDIAAARSVAMAEAEGVTEADARSRLLRTSQRFVDGVREIQLHVAGRPGVIQTLIDRGIGGSMSRPCATPLVLPAPA